MKEKQIIVKFFDKETNGNLFQFPLTRTKKGKLNFMPDGKTIKDAIKEAYKELP